MNMLGADQVTCSRPSKIYQKNRAFSSKLVFYIAENVCAAMESVTIALKALIFYQARK